MLSNSRLLGWGRFVFGLRICLFGVYPLFSFLAKMDRQLCKKRDGAKFINGYYVEYYAGEGEAKLLFSFLCTSVKFFVQPFGLHHKF